MKRTTFTASAAAGLLAASLATPVWAQATTYPDGTDCGAITDSASRQDCMSQMNESRQNPAPGSVTDDPDGAGNIQPGAPDAPDNRSTTGSSPDSNVDGEGVGN